MVRYEMNQRFKHDKEDKKSLGIGCDCGRVMYLASVEETGNSILLHMFCEAMGVTRWLAIGCKDRKSDCARAAYVNYGRGHCAFVSHTVKMMRGREQAKGSREGRVSGRDQKGRKSKEDV